jgi:hypothetical protein
MKQVSKYLFGSLLIIILFSAVTSTKVLAQSGGNVQKDKPYAVEYYYKAKWGYADEFIQLYKKNHYPVMQKEKELGRILSISVEKPRLHTTEDGRWDFRVTIVWKNIAVTDDGYDEQALINQLYPDKAAHDKEEQRRFDILLAHWDLPVVDVDLDK